MNIRYFFGLFAILVLVGAGCSQSLEARVAKYEAERTNCIEERRQAYDVTLDGVPGVWDEWQEQKAEYACSTVDLAKKYYATDPEGIVELCVRTELIGSYTPEKGLGGSLSSAELDELHASGALLDVTMDEAGIVTVGEETLEDWKGLCEIAINNVLGDS